MKVSFDLDDTRFVSPAAFATEKAPPFPLNKIYRERLRLGTIALLRAIRARGMEVWIYTTSFRSERYIRGLFRCYGLSIDQVVNGERHAREVQAGKRDIMPSKCPNRYHIDLHVDDDLSVWQNGMTYGFKVHIVGPPDETWDQKILDTLDNLQRFKQNGGRK